MIGGSASTAFALPDEKLAWPNLLEQEFSGIAVIHESIPGMTLSRSIKVINESDKSDILILHFGTSVGWPSLIVNWGSKFGLDVHNEAALHQPPLKYSGTPQRRLKKNFKLRTRNFLKYILYFLGGYKPRTSIQEVEDQVRAVLSVATKKASNVIWIQHHNLQFMRIAVERRMYAKYYDRLVKAIQSHSSEKLRLIQLEPAFLTSENYLLDGIHLSELGHRRIAEKLKKVLSESY